MKTIKAFYLVLLLLLSIISVDAQINETNWDYPVKPGKPGWGNLKNKQEMTDRCQIPSDLLSKISTERLLNLCLNYPLLPDIFFYDNLKEGFTANVNSFNGLKELLKRGDLRAILLMKYDELVPDLINSQDLEADNNTFKFIYMELLLAEPSFVSQLSEIQKKEILSIALKKYTAKKRKPEVYSVFNLKTSLLIMFEYIKQDKQIASVFDFSNPQLSQFEKRLVYPGDSIENLIVNKTNEFLNK